MDKKECAITREIETPIIDCLNTFTPEEKKQIISDVEKEEEVKLIENSPNCFIVEGLNAVQAIRRLCKKVQCWFT